MSLFSWLFKENIEKIKDPKKLLDTLLKRVGWSEINPEIIEIIFENANNDIQKLQKFITVSEVLNCVGQNFISLSKSHSRAADALDYFSVTLYNCGSNHLKMIPEDKYEDKKEIIANCAESSFQSSILCNRYMFTSYTGLIYLYLTLNRQSDAEDVFREMKSAYKAIVKTDESILTFFNRASKELAPNVIEDTEKIISGHVKIS